MNRDHTIRIPICLMIIVLALGLTACGKKSESITDKTSSIKDALAEQAGKATADAGTSDTSGQNNTSTAALAAKDAGLTPEQIAERDSIHAILRENGTVFEAFQEFAQTVDPGEPYKKVDHKWDETPWESQKDKASRDMPGITESDIIGKYVQTGQLIGGQLTDMSYLAGMDEAYQSILWLGDDTLGLKSFAGIKTDVRWNADGWINLSEPFSKTFVLKGDELRIIHGEGMEDIYKKSELKSGESMPEFTSPDDKKATDGGKRIEGRVYRLTRIVDPEAAEFNYDNPGYTECDPFSDNVLYSADDNFVVFTDDGYGFRRMQGKDRLFYYEDDKDFWVGGGSSFFRSAQNFGSNSPGYGVEPQQFYQINGTTLRVYESTGYLDYNLPELERYSPEVTTFDTWFEYELVDDTGVVTVNPYIGPIDSWDEIPDLEGEYIDTGLWKFAGGILYYESNAERFYVEDFHELQAGDRDFGDVPARKTAYLEGDVVSKHADDFYLMLEEGGTGWLHLMNREFPVAWSDWGGIYAYDIAGWVPIWDGHFDENFRSVRPPYTVGLGDNELTLKLEEGASAPRPEWLPENGARDGGTVSDGAGADNGSSESGSYDNSATGSAGDGSWVDARELAISDEYQFELEVPVYDKNGKMSGKEPVVVDAIRKVDPAVYNESKGMSIKHITLEVYVTSKENFDDMYFWATPFDKYTGTSLATRKATSFLSTVSGPRYTEPGGYVYEMYTRSIDTGGTTTDFEVLTSWGWTDFSDYDYETEETTYYDRIFFISYAIDCPEDYDGLLFQFSTSTKEQAEANSTVDYSRTGTATLDETPYFNDECIYLSSVMPKRLDGKDWGEDIVKYFRGH